MSDPNKLRSDAMIGEVLKNVAKQYHSKSLTTAEQQCLARIQVVSRQIGRDFMSRLNLLPMRPSKAQAFDEIAELWRDALKDWSRDDLLFALSLANSQINVDQISEELA